MLPILLYVNSLYLEGCRSAPVVCIDLEYSICNADLITGLLSYNH
jgi:hypothetical protein